MAYDDTKWGGLAKIIVDTSTMTAGDTVRVRSMTDANAIYDKTVVTAGTPLLFENEIFKDYVKICTVQEIGGVATEIGGVYKEVDYGQTIFVNVLDKTTLQGIQSILNAHQELDTLNIGDEITLKINAGGTPADWIMQIAAIDLYDSHRIDFVSKEIWEKTSYGTNTTYYSDTSLLRPLVQSFYTAMEDSDKQYIKEIAKAQHTSAYQSSAWSTYRDKIWIPNLYEVTAQYTYNGSYAGTPPQTIRQLPIFTTQADRIKKLNDSELEWWTCDGSGAHYGGGGLQYITKTGTGTSANNTSNQFGVLPCFTLIADA